MVDIIAMAEIILQAAIWMCRAPSKSMDEFERKMLSPTIKTSSSSFVKNPNLELINLIAKYPGTKRTRARAI
jgi:hypothetical protein